MQNLEFSHKPETIQINLILIFANPPLEAGFLYNGCRLKDFIFSRKCLNFPNYSTILATIL